MVASLVMKGSSSQPDRGRGSSQSCRGGFSLIEVMAAAVVLALGIVAAITTIQRGLQALDTARNLTAASQLMQSELERLRLKNWSQVQTLQDGGDTVVSADAGAPSRFICRRFIRDLKVDMKEIVLVAEWNGYDGRAHTARLITRYGRSGLNDYFYTTH